jgi:hypothetical protein
VEKRVAVAAQHVLRRLQQLPDLANHAAAPPCWENEREVTLHVATPSNLLEKMLQRSNTVEVLRDHSCRQVGELRWSITTLKIQHRRENTRLNRRGFEQRGTKKTRFLFTVSSAVKQTREAGAPTHNIALRRY